MLKFWPTPTYPSDIMRGVTANGPEIVKIRLERGLTQDQLAAEARLDVKTIRKAEQGNRIDLSTLTRVALALDTDLSRLIDSATAEPEDHVQRRDVILQWHRAWEAGDMDALLGVYHPDATLSLPGGPNIPFGGKYCGRNELRQAHEIAWSTIRHEPLRVDEFDILVTGDSVTLTGQKGVFLPTGELMRFPCVQVFRFRGNQIAAHDVQYDTLEFVKRMQLPL